MSPQFAGLSGGLALWELTSVGLCSSNRPSRKLRSEGSVDAKRHLEKRVFLTLIFLFWIFPVKFRLYCWFFMLRSVEGAEETPGGGERSRVVSWP